MTASHPGFLKGTAAPQAGGETLCEKKGAASRKSRMPAVCESTLSSSNESRDPISREAKEAALREAGLRVTAPRLATMDVVDAHPHIDAESVAQQVRERLGSVSTQAVYDVLHALTEAEILRRIAVKGRSALYETHRHDNHHHLVCRECGRLEDVQCATGKAPCLHVQPGDDFGFLIDEAEVIYRGYCPRCQKARAV